MSTFDVSAFKRSSPPRQEKALQISLPVLEQDKVEVYAGRRLPSPPPNLDKKGNHEAYLDALRGLAFLGVLTVHTSFIIPALSPRIDHLALYGRFGVQLFFVISAFTLMLSSRSRIKRESSPTLNFFVRRLSRIAPLYWAGLVFYTLTGGITFHHHGRGLGYSLPQGIGWKQILTNLTFTHGLFPKTINSAVPGGWSIAAEMIFYLIFPVLLVKITNIRRAAVLTCLAFLLAVTAKHFFLRMLSPAWHAREAAALPDFLYYWFPAQFCVFTLGVLLFFVVDLQKKLPWFDEPRNRRALSLSVISASLVLILHLLRYDTVPHVPVQFAFGVAFLLLAWGLSLVPWRVIVNRALCSLGTVSYSCYIWHFFVLARVKSLVFHKIMLWSHANPTMQFSCAWVVTLSGTLFLAFLSYRFIETPGIALGRRILTAREQRKAAGRESAMRPHGLWGVSGTMSPIRTASPAEGIVNAL